MKRRVILGIFCLLHTIMTSEAKHIPETPEFCCSLTRMVARYFVTFSRHKFPVLYYLTSFISWIISKQGPMQTVRDLFRVR